MCVYKKHIHRQINLLQSHFSVELQRPPKYLRSRSIGFSALYYNSYICLAAKWTVKKSPGSPHQMHQCCVWRWGWDVLILHNREWWMSGKLWCFVIAGKPTDMFDLLFKLWQPRNYVAYNKKLHFACSLFLLWPEFLYIKMTQHTAVI